MISTINTINTKAVDKFYAEYFCFSYSSLNKLLHSAQSFYKWYVIRQREDSLASYLVEGKAIHCLLLEKELFDKQFVIMPGSVPGVTIKKIVEYTYKLWKVEKNPKLKLKDFETEILQWLVDNNLHQALTDDKDLSKQGAKTGNQKRLEKVLTTDANSYFEYFKNSEGKDVISQEAFDKCQEAVSLIKQNKTVTELLKLNQTGFELLEVYNEQALSCALKEYPFGLKGIVDNYVIDHTLKKVYINDLKTTGKTLNEFKDTVNYYKYWMQGAIYTRLVKSRHPEVANYEFVLHFVVIDKNNLVYPFPVSNQSLLDWQSQLDEVLEIAKYHYTKKDYTLPYEFALGQVTL
jgi:hypothetical protein